MANRSGILALADSLRASFAAWSLPIVVGRVGKAQRARWDNQAPTGAGRVLLLTNDPDGGELVRAKLGTGNPRVAFQWNQRVTLSVWAVDPERRDDEEAQIEATEALFERVLDALENGTDPISSRPLGSGIFETPLTVKRVATENQNLYFGLELQMPLTVKTLLYQRPIPTTLATAAPTANLEPGPIVGQAAAE